jgi:hypothetical protein
MRMALRSKVRHYTLEIVRAYGDIGIIDEQKVVASLGSKLRERADFSVRSQARRALDQSNRPIGKILLQLLDCGCGWVVFGRDSKQHLKFARISLFAVASERVEHTGVKPLE